MWSWNATSQDELQQRLKLIPDVVPPRGQGRETRHVENWVLRHLLWTLANTTSLLAYPLSVEKGERPDLDLRTPSGSVGIEVTEAVPPNYAQAIAIWNKHYPTAIVDPSLFEWGAPPRTACEIHDLFRQQGQRLSGPGWLGESVEQEWASRIAAALLFKTDALNEPTFRRQDQNWLTIYDNTPRPALCVDVASTYLSERLAAAQRGGVKFDRVFVELSEELLMVAGGHVARLQLHRP